MKHWIDRESETDNVIILSDTGILIGSCDEDVYDSVDQQLSAQKNPNEVLGAEDLTALPYAQIQSVSSLSTDKDVNVRYKAKKDIEDKTLFFDSLDAKQSFVAALGDALPDHLEKTETQQSIVSASLSPLLSLLLSCGSIYLFIDKLRWPTIIVGGIWALGSLYMLVSRAKSPPHITRWNIKGRYVRKAWTGIKTAFAYVVLAAIIAVVHEALPDAYGSSTIYEQMQFETLSADSVGTLLERGADINYVGEDGDTTLSIALDWGENDIAVALIEAGADLSIRNSVDQTPIEQVISYDLDVSLLDAMLRNGASLDFTIEDMSPLEYATYYEYADLVSFLQRYVNEQ